MKVILEGQYSGKRTLPGLNDYIGKCRTNPYAAAQMKKKYQNLWVLMIKQQIRKKITTPISLTFRFYEKDKLRDKDNIFSFCLKIFLDALQVSGKLKNDGWGEIDNFNAEFYVDKKTPRIEVEITERRTNDTDGTGA